MRRRRRSATIAAASASQPSSVTTNASTPQRPVQSVGRSVSCSVRAVRASASSKPAAPMRSASGFAWSTSTVMHGQRQARRRTNAAPRLRARAASTRGSRGPSGRRAPRCGASGAASAAGPVLGASALARALVAEQQLGARLRERRQRIGRALGERSGVAALDRSAPSKLAARAERQREQTRALRRARPRARAAASAIARSSASPARGSSSPRAKRAAAAPSVASTRSPPAPRAGVDLFRGDARVAAEPLAQLGEHGAQQVVLRARAGPVASSPSARAAMRSTSRSSAAANSDGAISPLSARAASAPKRRARSSGGGCLPKPTSSSAS